MPLKLSKPPSNFRSLDDPETLRNLVRNLGEGIYITAEDGEILDANDAFLRMFGVGSLEELKKDRRAEDLYADPARRNRVKEALSRAGEIREMELEIRRADGAILTVLDTSYACRDAATGEVFYHGILVDINERKELERRLLEASIRDPLTGCYNRRHMEQLEAEVNRHIDAWGCVFVDLDDFKRYNDTHGHAAGDAALVVVAHFLMRQIRTTDAVVRVGGDEFLAVFRAVSEFELRGIVKRFECGAIDVATVPFSLGWAVKREDESFSQMVQRADQRLLQVRGGGGRFSTRRRQDNTTN